MKKSFGIGNIYIKIETEDERYEYLDTIKALGYSYNFDRGSYTNTNDEALIFLEKGIKNTIGLNFATLREGLSSGVYRNKDIPLVTKESIFMDNGRVKSGYNFLTIEAINGVNISYNNRDNYRIRGTKEFVNKLIKNNFTGIKCDVDVGVFKKNEAKECNFELYLNNLNLNMKMVVSNVR